MECLFATRFWFPVLEFGIQQKGQILRGRISSYIFVFYSLIKSTKFHATEMEAKYAFYSVYNKKIESTSKQFNKMHDYDFTKFILLMVTNILIVVI